jgi:hypothetical protein
MNIIMKIFILILTMCHGYLLNAQDALPYYEIPSAPMQYTATNIASRLIDGLGFRYYWATEGLREEDLAFKPGEETRSTQETMLHIYGMSVTINNVITQSKIVPDQITEYSEIRKQTLFNLKSAAENLQKYNDEDLMKLVIEFGKGSNMVSFPFWNIINGQISDCLWHTGQLVTFRRLSGNPISNKINLFTGTVRE